MNFDDLETKWDEKVDEPVYVPQKKAMNFDDLKIKWEEEDHGPVYIPQKIAHLKEAQHPLDKLKQNMKMEIYFQLLCLSLVFFAILVHEEDEFLHVVCFFATAVVAIISAFYLSKLYKFYKSVHVYTLDTKDSLQELYYNLRLNMERYKSFTFLAMSFFIMHQGIMLYSKLELVAVTTGQYWDNNFSLLLLKYILPMTISILLVIVLTNWWVNFFYGKYAKQIKSILDELKET